MRAYEGEAAPHTAAVTRPIRVLVLGLRGVIDVPGGIETHARHLYPLLVRMGCDVEVIQRAPYFRERRPEFWHGVRLSYLWSPTRPALETAVHTVLGTVYAAFRRPDILHLHAVGPGLLAPFARLLGLRVVVTHHAEDYRQEKWGTLAKTVLRTGEWLAMRFANQRITVSPVIAQNIKRRIGVQPDVIPNGTSRVVRAASTTAPAAFGLKPGHYVLCVARITPTKRLHELIEAFRQARLPDEWKLVLVGGLDDSDYVARIRRLAAGDDRIVLTDFQRGRALRELYSHAGLFVLPSAVEGHPIALLEALSYGIPALASAIPGNLTVPLPRSRFVEVGDIAAWGTAMTAAADDTSTDWAALREKVRDLYSWRSAAAKTLAVYQRET